MSTKLLTAVILLALAPAADAYVLRHDSTGTNVQWRQAVTFVLDTGAAKALGDGALEAVQASASQIALAADVGLTVKTGETHGVGFSESGPNENAIVLLEKWPFAASAIASTVITVDVVSHQILDADVALNGSSHHFGVLSGEEDGDDAPSDDVENTTTHELGHAMGLQHNPDDPTVVMYPTAHAHETSKRELQADDKAGLVALYPPGSVASGTPRGCNSAPGPFAVAMLLLLILVARRKTAPVPVRVSARKPPKLLFAAVLASAAVARAEAPKKLERVAEGKVVQVRTLEPRAGDRLLYSEVTLQLSKCHGNQSGCDGALKFTVPGGKWGHLEQSVTDQPVPVEGEPLAVALSQKVERIFHLEQPAERAALQKTLSNFKEESWPK